MKKISLGLIAISGLVAASVALADPNLHNGYYSTVPSTAKTLSAKAKYSLTDITINNRTNVPIAVELPNTGFRDLIAANGGIKHIQNDNVATPTYILLLSYGAGIFPVIGQDPLTGYVCNHSIIDVYGNPGNYSVYVNRICN